MAIHDRKARGSLLMFFARTRRGWTETVVDRHKEPVRGLIEYHDMEKMGQELSDKIDLVRQRLTAGKTGESSEDCAREDHQFAA